MARARPGLASLLLLLLPLLLLLLGASASRWDTLRGDISGDTGGLEGDEVAARVRHWAASFAGDAAAIKADDFSLGDLEEKITGSGGSFSVWNKDHQILQDTDIQAGLMRLEPQGLLLPSYTDSHQLHYVVRGSGKMGLVTPLGVLAGVHNLDSGKLILHPRGWVRWVWNDGKEPLEIISVSDTSRSTEREGARAARAEQTHFWLAGADKGENAGLLHGFSADILAQAWDVKEEDVTALLEGQKESALIKVKSGEVAGINAAVARAQREQSNAFFGDFAFDMEEREKDYEDPKAGWISVVNGWKARNLRHLGLAAGRVHLEPKAMTAPRWVGNTAVLYYVIKGEATVEVVYPNGKPALRRAIKAGEAMGIPAGYARASIASGDGFEGVGFSLETSRPYAGYIAGRNAWSRAIPRNIERAAFGVKDDVLDEIANHRREEYVLLRPAGAEPGPKAATFGEQFFGQAEEDPFHEQGVAFF